VVQLFSLQHSILVAIFYMLQRDQPYHDLGVDYFIRREDPHRRARKLIRQLEAIGYTVQAQPPPPAAA
jgi:transposase